MRTSQYTFLLLWHQWQSFFSSSRSWQWKHKKGFCHQVVKIRYNSPAPPHVFHRHRCCFHQSLSFLGGACTENHSLHDSFIENDVSVLIINFNPMLLFCSSMKSSVFCNTERIHLAGDVTFPFLKRRASECLHKTLTKKKKKKKSLFVFSAVKLANPMNAGVVKAFPWRDLIMQTL